MVTFSALVNIILFSSLSVMLLRIVFNDNKIVLKLDIRFLLVCLLTILIRLLIPIESPFTKEIPIYHIYPDIYSFLKRPLLNYLKLSIIDILKILWLFGSFYFLNKSLKSYFKLNKSIKKLCQLTDKKTLEVKDKVQKEIRSTVTFYLVGDEFIDTPIVFGLLKPYIVLPKTDFTEEELYFIIKHEMIHYFHGDLIVKIFCELLGIVYWWNPFANMLKKLISNLQEINTDYSVMKGLSDEKKLDYLENLVKVAKDRESSRKSSQWLMAFQKENSSAVHKRITLMLENMEINKKKTVSSMFLSIIIFGLVVFCPNILAFEPYAISQKDAEGTFDIKTDDIFYLANSDNSYSLFWDGQYVATVTEMLGDNIQIYNSLEEVKRNEQSSD